MAKTKTASPERPDAARTPPQPPPSPPPDDDADDQREDIDPKFSKRAAQVVQSAFWGDISSLDPDPETGEEPLEDGERRKQLVALVGKLDEHRAVLQESLIEARRYEDLPPSIKQLFDEVEAYNKGAKSAEPTDKNEKKQPARNVFCATGPGGGIDPTCSPGESTKTKEKDDRPEWDGTIDQDAVDSVRGSREEVRSWDFYDDDGDHFPQTVYVVRGEYDTDPDGDDPDSIIDVWRWESHQDGAGMIESGDWVADEDEAREAGERYAEDNDQQPPEEEEDEEEEDEEEEDEEEEDDVDSRWDSLFSDHAIDDAESVPSRDDADELVGVAGVLDGAKVSVKKDINDDVEINVSHPKIKNMTRTLMVDNDGKLYCHNDIFVIKEQYRKEGIGADVFAAQVKACAKFGVSYIETHAARGADYNGYYTWPRFGYDQSIDSLGSSYAAKVREVFPGVNSVLDVMETKEGREWWKANGVAMKRARFDLRTDSRSMRVLNAYLRERSNS